MEMEMEMKMAYEMQKQMEKEKENEMKLVSYTRRVSNVIQILGNKLEGNLDAELDWNKYMGIYNTISLLGSDNDYNWKPKLYDMYRKSLEEYISSNVLPALTKEHDDESMIREVVKRWNNHKVMVETMSRMFQFLERHFVPRENLLPLSVVGLNCFIEPVFDDKLIDVNNVVLQFIKRMRDGEQVDSSLLQYIVNMLVEIRSGDLDYYKNHFEKPMFEDTQIYYARKAALWILEDSCPEYMLKAEEFLKTELSSVAPYLHSSSRLDYVEMVENELLFHYAHQLLDKQDSGLDALIWDDKKDDVSRLYRLFCRVPDVPQRLASRFEQHIIKSAEDAVNDHEDFVHKVVEMYDRFADYVEHVFQNDKCILKAFREAFVVICNKGVGGSTTPELFAEFFDNVLKNRSTVKMTDDPNESLCEKVVKLVEYVSDKDLLVGFCRKKLAGRLLFNRSANIDDEQKILLRLKKLYGFHLTSKMENMVNDFIASKKIETEFNNSQKNLKFTFGVTVLSRAFWPTYKSSDLNLPYDMASCLDEFTEFYSVIYKRRELTWIYSLGTCNIISKFDTKVIEIEATTYQAVLLLLFNDHTKLSYEDIKYELNLEDEDVIGLLHSLSCGKYKILLKQPTNTTVSVTDNFELNPTFSHKLNKIRIPLPEMNQKKSDLEAVIESRRYKIQAAIARIMKARKILHHQQLLSECVEELQGMFVPKFKAIKEGIESLISDDYLERDRENPDLLRYLP